MVPSTLATSDNSISARYDRTNIFSGLKCGRKRAISCSYRQQNNRPISMSSKRRLSRILILTVIVLSGNVLHAQYRYTRLIPVDSNTMLYGGFFHVAKGTYQFTLTSKYPEVRTAYVIARLDAAGQPMWSNAIASDTNVAIDVVPVTDDRPQNGVEYLQYISRGFDTTNKVWGLVHVDSNGSVVATRTLELGFESISAAQRTGSGDLVICGARFDQRLGQDAAFITVLDSGGRPRWMRMASLPKSSGSIFSFFNGVTVLSDRSILCYGTQSIIGAESNIAVAVLFGPDGTFRNAISGAGLHWGASFTSATELSSGDVVLGGFTMTVDGGEDAIIRVYDSRLNERYSRLINFLGNDAVIQVLPDSNGGLIVISGTDYQTSGSSGDVTVIGVTRIDRSGIGMPSRAISVHDGIQTIPQDAIRTPEGILVMGTIRSVTLNRSPGFITQLDARDSSCISTNISYGMDTVAAAIPLRPEFDSTLLTGLLMSPPSLKLQQYRWKDSVICLEPDESFDTVPVVHQPQELLLFPNPCIRGSQQLTLRLPASLSSAGYHIAIRSAFGAIVRTYSTIGNADGSAIPLAVSDLAAGYYILEVFDASGTILLWRGNFVLE